MLTKSGNLSQTTPVIAIAEREAKEQSFARHGKTKRRAPKQSTEKKVQEQADIWSYIPVKLLKKRFKRPERFRYLRMKAHITVVAREKKDFLACLGKPAQVEIEPIAETTVVKANRVVSVSCDEINAQTNG